MSESVDLALPSARSGMIPLVSSVCLAGFSLLQVHVSESVVSTGTATAITGTEGLYFATSLAVDPPLVRTMMSCASTLWAVLTAEEARDSRGAIGMWACFMMFLKRE